MEQVRARLGLLVEVEQAEVLGQEVGWVGASPPAEGAQACHCC